MAITNKLEEFKNADFSFGSSRECQFVEELVSAVSENSSQAYAQACADFDRISPLDPIKTHVLMKGKANIMEETDEVDLNGTVAPRPDLPSIEFNINLPRSGSAKEDHGNRHGECSMPTAASYLAARGYATGFVGKWYARPQLP